MKKSAKKLTLNKMTISNLDASEMHQKMGGILTTTTVWFPPYESIFCWTEKCERFTQRVTCTSINGCK